MQQFISQRIFKRRTAQTGMSSLNALMLGLLAVILLLSAYGIYSSVRAQKNVSQTFIGWAEDKAGYDKTMAEMRATGKPALVYIYASWCPHCKEFAAKILSKKDVREFVKQYPRVRVAPDNGQAEKDIMRDFEAQGYPSFYVVLPDGSRHAIEPSVMEGMQFRMKTPREFIRNIQQVTALPAPAQVGKMGGMEKKEQQGKSENKSKAVAHE